MYMPIVPGPVNTKRILIDGGHFLKTRRTERSALAVHQRKCNEFMGKNGPVPKGQRWVSVWC